LPGLPWNFWNLEALQAIRNSSGTFIAVDDLTLMENSRKMEKVLVAMEIHSGLLEVLEIEWRGRSICQRLEYLGLPFRCTLCRSTGHMRRDCNGFLEEEEETKDYSFYQPSLDLSPGEKYFQPRLL
jgi:hypothetical protein